MATETMQAYATLATSGLDSTQRSGRYPFHKTAEARIIGDVLYKLKPCPEDRLLDIGCGPGNLLIPLSFMVKEAVGIDHPTIVAQCMQRFADSRVTWLSGEFPGVKPVGTFDCILVYSVLHYLQNFEAVQAFVLAAAHLLSSPGGRLLIGDIPNADRKMRFRASAFGRQFEAEWERNKAVMQGDSNSFDAFESLQFVRTLDDEMILALVRSLRHEGFHSDLISQPADLPMGYTREDILVVKP